MVHAALLAMPEATRPRHGSVPITEQDWPPGSDDITFHCAKKDGSGGGNAEPCYMMPGYTLWGDVYNYVKLRNVSSVPTFLSFQEPAHRSTAGIIFRTILEESAKRPWSQRNSQFYLSGNCHTPKAEYFLFAAREQHKATLDPSYFPVADANMAWYHEGNKGNGNECTEDVISDIRGNASRFFKTERWWHHLDYQFLVSEPGNRGAPRIEFVYLLLSGAVVVAKKFERVEFYYDDLVPDVHYIEFSDIDELPAIREKLLADPAWAQSIVRNAEKYVETHLTEDAVLKQVQYIIQDYLARHPE